MAGTQGEGGLTMGRSTDIEELSQPAQERVPVPLSEGVSQRMSRMPRRNSKPETRLRSELHARGLRFRINNGKLPGRPDIVFSRARLAVFCDGCFWHVCPQHATWPKNNGDWWRAKLEANVARDRRQDEALEQLGWLSVRVWEHESVSEAADRVERAWRRRTQRVARGSTGQL